MKIKKYKVESFLFNTFNTAFMLALMAVTLYPFLNTIAVSFNDGLDSLRGGIYLWPRVFTLKNYQAVFVSGTIYRAFFNSVARSLISMIVNVFFTTMLAYTLSRREYVFRKPITLLFVLTMYFNAGLIPYYFTIRSLGLINNFLVYIVPSMLGAWNLIVVRTYIRTLPEALIESARIDGAGDFRIFWSVIMPLCKPVMAVVALFVAVGSWNDWFTTFLFCGFKPELSTMQYELMKLLTSTQNANANQAVAASAYVMGENASRSLVTPISIRSAITVVAAVPILFVYPFLQKHFVAGLNVGSVKE